MLVKNLDLFRLIIKKGSLVAAGRELNLSPARVSERLADLEAHYQARLLNRTTRSISLTDAGQEVLKRADHILSEIEELEARIKYGKERISGTITVTAANDFGKNILAPMLNDFMKQHSEIAINIILDDGYVDLVNNGIDLAFRVGELSDTALNFITLATNKRIICASPQYIEQHGTPNHPSELSEHNCLLIKFGAMTDKQWKFIVNGKVETFTVSGNRTANNGELVADWCRAGYGVAFKSLWDVYEDLEKGTLVHLLKDYEMPVRPLQLVHAPDATKSRRIRLLIEYLQEAMKVFH